MFVNIENILTTLPAQRRLGTAYLGESLIDPSDSDDMKATSFIPVAKCGSYPLPLSEPQTQLSIWSG